MEVSSKKTTEDCASFTLASDSEATGIQANQEQLIGGCARQDGTLKTRALEPHRKRVAPIERQTDNAAIAKDQGEEP